MAEKLSLSKTKASPFLDISLRDMFKPFLSTGRASFKKTFELLDKAKLSLDGSMVSILDLTPEQIVDTGNVNIIKKIFTDSDGPFQKLEQTRTGDVPLLRSVQVDFDQVLKGGGSSIGTSWLKKTMQADTIMGGGGGIGKAAWEALTLESGKMGQRKYKFPSDFNPRITQAIAQMDGPAKNAASLAYLGGFRPSDMAKIRIEHIDFATGEIMSTLTKAGDVEGVLNPALLDIVKQQAGGREKGLLFEGFTQFDSKGQTVFKTSFQNGINKSLRDVFGDEKISYISPNTKELVEEKVNIKSLRHHVEDAYNKLKIFPKDPDRLVATLRPVSQSARAGSGGVGGAYGIITQAGDFEDAVKMQARVSSVIAGYNGRTPHTWMVGTGYPDEIISPDTKTLVANQNDLKNNLFKNNLIKSETGAKFYNALPVSEGAILSTPIDTKGLQAITDEAAAKATQGALVLEGENIALESKNLAAKTELDKEKLNVSEQMKDLKEDKALQRKISSLSDTEKLRYERFKTKFVDATPTELYEAVKGKGPGYTKFLKNYAGKIIASKGLKSTGIGVLGGELTRRSIQKAETAEFGPNKGSIVDRLGNALGLTTEDMASIGQGIRHATNVASSVPVIGTAALPFDLAATTIIPNQEEKDLGASMRSGVSNWWEESKEKAATQQRRRDAFRVMDDETNIMLDMQNNINNN
jgi:hypothetical protein